MTIRSLLTGGRIPNQLGHYKGQCLVFMNTVLTSLRGNSEGRPLTSVFSLTKPRARIPRLWLLTAKEWVAFLGEEDRQISVQSLAQGGRRKSHPLPAEFITLVLERGGHWHRHLGTLCSQAMGKNSFANRRAIVCPSESELFFHTPKILCFARVRN